MMPGMPIDPAILAAILQQMQGGGQPMQQQGAGRMANALPFIGAAGGMLGGLGDALQFGKASKEAAKSRRLQEHSVLSNAAQGNTATMMALMRLLGGSGLYGR